jgi:hypothetical protein
VNWELERSRGLVNEVVSVGTYQGSAALRAKAIAAIAAIARDIG